MDLVTEHRRNAIRNGGAADAEHDARADVHRDGGDADEVEHAEGHEFHVELLGRLPHVLEEEYDAKQLRGAEDGE